MGAFRTSTRLNIHGKTAVITKVLHQWAAREIQLKTQLLRVFDDEPRHKWGILIQSYVGHANTIGQ